MKGLAVIPTIGRSSLLVPLVERLRGEDFAVVLIDNEPPCNAGSPLYDALDARYIWRPAWRGIYRQWNLGIRLGAYLDAPTLILNDDIVLDPGAATRMADWLDGDYAVLGFDYGRPLWMHLQHPYIEQVFGTYRQCGVGGFAFGVNPRRCARVDERFQWWGGDDDLMHATMAKGERIGLLKGAYVAHPTPSLTANANPHLLPEGWAEHDRALMEDKWGGAW